MVVTGPETVKRRSKNVRRLKTDSNKRVPVLQNAVVVEMHHEQPQGVVDGWAWSCSTSEITKERPCCSQSINRMREETKVLANHYSPRPAGDPLCTV